MKIVNRKIGNEITVCKQDGIINFLGVPTKMKDCGISILGDDDSIFNTHIENCLDTSIILRYINRFLECETKDELKYIKLLAKRGLEEGQEVNIDGKHAKILHWSDSNKYMPMYILKTSKGEWSKKKRVIYGNTIITGYKDFNNKIS